MPEQCFLLRLPTSMEWDLLVDATNGDDGRMHWKYLFSWCQDPFDALYYCRTLRGCSSADNRDHNYANFPNSYVGFRPVLEPMAPDALRHFKDGESLQFGVFTITCTEESTPGILSGFTSLLCRDIPSFVKNAQLDIRNASSSEQKRIQWVKCGNILISAHNILCAVSWNDLHEQDLVYGREVVLDLPERAIE